MAARSKRQLIVESGLDLVHRHGFASSGVAAITAAGGAPKGSFYNHFASKDAFGVALLDRYFEDVQAALAVPLGDRAVPPVERIRRYFALLRDLGERDVHARGCLVGNLSAEASPSSRAIRARLESILAEWTESLATAVDEAQTRREARGDVQAATLAALLIDGWQGALLRAKVERTSAPLDAFLDVLLPSLLGSEPR